MYRATREEVKRFLDLFRQLNKEQQIGVNLIIEGTNIVENCAVKRKKRCNR